MLAISILLYIQCQEKPTQPTVNITAANINVKDGQSGQPNQDSGPYFPSGRDKQQSGDSLNQQSDGGFSEVSTTTRRTGPYFPVGQLQKESAVQQLSQGGGGILDGVNCTFALVAMAFSAVALLAVLTLLVVVTVIN